MSRPPETAPAGSSVVPRFLARWVAHAIQALLPLKWADRLYQFWVQTRLIFSRAILLLVGALFAFFTFVAFEQNTIREDDVFGMLTFQVMILSILLNMNLWEVEREGRTFELLIMRIPSLHRLIWFKLRVSLFWLAFLSLPFFAAYAWFVSIPFSHILLFFIFIVSYAVLVAFATCVVTSFVHHGLTAGVVTFILSSILIASCQGFDYAWADYIRVFQHPFELKAQNLNTIQKVWRLMINRATLGLAIACCYWWLYRRLAKTEKWIQ